MIPSVARIIVRNSEREVPVEKIVLDQIVVVKPNEVFPVDGIIVEGETITDEREVTSLVGVEKIPYSRVFAGTVNTGNRVLVRVGATGESTLAARLAAFIKHQRASTEAKSKSRPNIVARAKQLFRPKREAAGPVLQQLAQAGIYVRDHQTLEKLRAVDTIVFDKTGIITTGARQIEHVVSFKPYTQQQLLNTAAALEVHSPHLTASAIVQFARERGAAALQRVEQVRDEGGVGVSGELNGKKVIVGPSGLLARKKIKLPKETISLKEQGFTVVYVAIEKSVAGYIALSNPVKKQAPAVIHALKKHYRTVLFTGEHEDTAATIGNAAGVHEVVASVHDSNRAQKIAELKSHGRRVAYVTALHPNSGADVTVTMGTKYAFSADASILHGNLSAVETLFLTLKEKKR